MSDIGALKPGTILGEAAKPPFAVLPDPCLLFLNRARRFAALAPNHELGPYLTFLSVLTGAQYAIQTDLPAPALPPFDRIGQALEHGMPPISRTVYEPDQTAVDTLERLLTRLEVAEVPPESTAAIQALLAGLQVHFARMASLLQASDLRPIANGACPVCGSLPVSSVVVGWPKAYNTRFCTCSLCGTMWNAVRIACLLCDSTDGISFRSVEDKPDTVKAETCDKCRGYVKILYQVKDPALDPLVDDVATLGLDMLMAEEGWKRGGQNPFLLGY